MAGHHANLGAGLSGVGWAGRVAGSGIEQAADGDANVAFKFSFGNAGSLEIELIEDGLVVLTHHAGRAKREARPEWHAEADHGAEAIGAEERGRPGDRRAPIVAGDDGLRGAECVEETDHVAD